MTIKIIQGDCRDVLRTMPAESVHVCVTSPPYWGLRDYRVPASIWGGRDDCEHEWGATVIERATNHTDERRWQHTRNGRDEEQPTEKRVGWLRSDIPQGQFCQHCGAWSGAHGLEPSYELFVANEVLIFREVRRVLRADGSLWLNLGDSYATGAGKVGDRPGGGAQGDAWGGHRGSRGGSAKQPHTGNAIGPMTQPNRMPQVGLKPKDLCGIPWRVAFALQADGWWLRSEIIWCLSGGTRVYARTQKGEMPMTIKDMVRLDPATVQLWNGERWTQVLGWSETPRPDLTYEIELRNGQRIGCTGNHEWPTQRGNVRADQLRAVGGLFPADIIQTCRLPEPTAPRMPAALDDDMVGWFVGIYIAEGSRHDGTVSIASHKREVARFQRLHEIADAFDGYFSMYELDGCAATAVLNGPIINALIDSYVSGRIAYDKHLSPRCWKRSDAFLRAVLDGYLAGDGHWEEHNQRWRLGFCSNDELAADLRTIAARLGISVRLKRAIHNLGGGEFPGYKGEVRFTRSNHHNNRDNGEVVAVRESRARKFWDIGVADEPHLFALASGVMTHNSKPNPMPESVTDRPTKSHEQVFLFTKSGESTFWTHRDLSGSRVQPEPDYRWVHKETGEESASPQDAAKWRRINLWRGHDYFFDQEAVREPPVYAKAGTTSGSERERNVGGRLDGYTTLKVPGGIGCPSPSGRNIRTVWTIATEPFTGSHFAVFPSSLAERCIKAGTSERGCCPACGAPWVRVVVVDRDDRVFMREQTVAQTSGASHRTINGVVPSFRSPKSNTTGFRPSCDCPPADPVPCTVLDPFSGAGTTGLVADRLGRDAILIELNEAYADMAAQRLRGDGGMFASVDLVHADEPMVPAITE